MNNEIKSLFNLTKFNYVQTNTIITSKKNDKTLPNKETLSFSFTGCNASFNQSQTAQKLCTVYIYNLVTSHTRKLFFKKLPFTKKHTGLCFSWYKATGATRLPCVHPNQLHDQELRNNHTSSCAPSRSSICMHETFSLASNTVGLIFRWNRESGGRSANWVTKTIAESISCIPSLYIHCWCMVMSVNNICQWFSLQVIECKL